MRSPKVLILYNEPVLPASHPDAESEHEILFTVDFVSKTLVQAGFQVSRLGASHDPELLLASLREQRPDVVFNLFEGTGDDGKTEGYVAGLLEWLDLPFTGCPFQTLCLARTKHLTKSLLRGAGLPTPDFFVVQELPAPLCPLEWPVIVKPASQDASVGLDQGSVVTDQQRLEERVSYLVKTYGPPVLVEEFIGGRELNVGLIEAPNLQVLPISEVLFVDKDPTYWPIVTYDAKWTPGSRDYEATPPRYPADVAPRLAERLGALACQAFRLLGCRDYARVDFRLRPSGKPYILEVNPNPDFSPTAGLSGGLTSAGLVHAQFTVDLVRAALARGRKPLAVRVKRIDEPQLRAPRKQDREEIQVIAEKCGIVHAEELSALLERFDKALGNGKCNAHTFLVLQQSDRVAGYACFGKAALAEGAFVLNGLAIDNAAQRQGLGLHLLRAVEDRVTAAGGRTLVAETSSQPRRTQARQFLARHGFRLVGDVPDFYREGEARLTYAKYLAPSK